MTNLVTLKAPSTISGQIITEWGNAVIDANGFVTVDARAATALQKAGFTAADLPIGSQTINASGLVPTALNLLSGRSAAGATLAAAAASGVFGITCTPGTVVQLISEAANNNTKTDKVVYEFTLPANYIAGQNVTVTANARYVTAGTVGTKTIDLSAYVQATDGTGTTDLCATDAQTLTTSAADYAFVLTGTNLVPGAKLLLQFTVAIQESAAGGNITANISSVRVG